MIGHEASPEPIFPGARFQIFDLLPFGGKTLDRHAHDLRQVLQPIGTNDSTGTLGIAEVFKLTRDTGNALVEHIPNGAAGLS